MRLRGGCGLGKLRKVRSDEVNAYERNRKAREKDSKQTVTAQRPRGVQIGCWPGGSCFRAVFGPGFEVSGPRFREDGH
jgi:hypothetical protein